MCWPIVTDYIISTPSTLCLLVSGKLSLSHDHTAAADITSEVQEKFQLNARLFDAT